MHTGIAALMRGGGLIFHHFIGRWLRVDFRVQCVLTAAFSALALIIASGIDHSLILSGDNIGLLQHPTIWTFIGLQVALPLSVRSSLKNLLDCRLKIRSIAQLREGFRTEIVMPLEEFVHLECKD